MSLSTLTYYLDILILCEDPLYETYKISALEKEEFEKENEINQLNDIEINSNFKESNNFSVFDKVKVEERIKNAEIQINLLNSEKISNKNQMELLETSLDEVEEKESELEELQNAQKEYEEKYDILKKTEKYLKQAKSIYEQLNDTAHVTQIDEILDNLKQLEKTLGVG